MDAMVHYRAIRRQVADLVAELVTLDQFKALYVPVSWSVGLDAPNWLRDVSGSIDLALAEFGNSHSSWPELLSLLHSAATIAPTDTLALAQSGPADSGETHAGQSPRVVTLALHLTAA